VNRYHAFGLIALVTLSACATDQLQGEMRENQAPQVWLSAAPPEGSVSKYTVHMYWGGWDPDGEISHYEYLVSDNRTGIFAAADTMGAPWMPVLGNDSSFTFSADVLADSNTTDQVSVFTRSHTFFIRAVDSEGKRSVQPAYRSFTSRTLSPSVTVLVPLRNQLNPADLPPIATFRWRATDFVDDRLNPGEPDSVQYALTSTAAFGGDFVKTIAYLSKPAAAREWHPWVYYRAPNDSGKTEWPNFARVRIVVRHESCDHKRYFDLIKVLIEVRTQTNEAVQCAVGCFAVGMEEHFYLAVVE
jgi:hypothetical protein